MTSSIVSTAGRSTSIVLVFWSSSQDPGRLPALRLQLPIEPDTPDLFEGDGLRFPADVMQEYTAVP